MDTEQGESANQPTPADGGRVARLKRGRARLAIVAGGAVLVILLLAWFIRFENFGKFQQSTDDAFVQTDAITIAPKVAGYVDRVYVADNQTVKAGQPLVRIDARDYSAQANQSRAQIDLAEATAAGARAQIDEQHTAVTRAEADLAAAQAAADYAEGEVARYRPLAATGADTQERFAGLRNDAAQADAKLEAARAALKGARQRVATLESQAQQARAQIEAARAQLAAASTNLEATELRATADGRIGDKTVRQGQYVQAATRLMTLIPTRSLYVEANFKETQLGLMRIGQPVFIEVDALPGVDIKGHVASISPGTGAQFSILPPQNATGNFTKIVQRVAVRIEIEADAETRGLLVPGMSVEVNVDTRSAKGELNRIRERQDQHNRKSGRH